jgi:hypothetical protein
MTNTKSLPSIDYLRKRLRYEPETGKLFWLDYEDMPNNWRARFAGKEAGTYTDEGYRQVRVDGISFQAHRVAYAIHHGEWPTMGVDHINGVKDDNRINNLRVVSHQDNLRNSSMKSGNTSGVNGVHWHKAAGKWQAQIMADNRRKHLGLFNTLEEAAAARKEASAKYGYTERHGTKAEKVE